MVLVAIRIPRGALPVGVGVDIAVLVDADAGPDAHPVDAPVVALHPRPARFEGHGHLSAVVKERNSAVRLASFFNKGAYHPEAYSPDVK